MEILKGRTKILTATITQAGVAKNLTGYEAELYIAEKSGVEPVAKIAGEISAPETGVITFNIKPSDLLETALGHYRFEINIWETNNPDIVYTPIVGTIDLKAGLDSSPGN